MNLASPCQRAATRAAAPLPRRGLHPHLERRAFDDPDEQSTRSGSSSRAASRTIARTTGMVVVRRARGRARRSAASRSTSRRRPRGAAAAPGAARRRRPPACRRPAGRSASIGLRLRRVTRHAPTASKFSSAKPIGSISLWQPAQAGFARCSSICSRIVSGFVQRRSSSLSGGTLARRRRRRRAEDVLEDPLAAQTGDVRSACDVTVRMLPWPSSPRRAFVGQRHAAEMAAVHVRDAVVPRQPLVDERVVRRQQIEDAAVLAHDAVEEQLGLAPERLPQVVVEVGELVRVRAACSAGCAGTATGRRSCRPAPATVGSASMRRTCCSSTPGVLELALRRDVEQLVVGNAAPEKERQARRQLEVADAVDASRRAASAGSRSTRKRNFGLASMRRSASSMPRRSSPSRAARRRRRPAGAGRRRRGQAAGTRGARASTMIRRAQARSRRQLAGRQTKIAAAARRVARRRSALNGPVDGERVDVRHRRSKSTRVGGAAHERLQARVGPRRTACARNATPTVVRAGLHRHRTRSARVDRVGRRRSGCRSRRRCPRRRRPARGARAAPSTVISSWCGILQAAHRAEVGAEQPDA